MHTDNLEGSSRSSPHKEPIPSTFFRLDTPNLERKCLHARDVDFNTTGQIMAAFAQIIFAPSTRPVIRPGIPTLSPRSPPPPRCRCTKSPGKHSSDTRKRCARRRGPGIVEICNRRRSGHSVPSLTRKWWLNWRSAADARHAAPFSLARYPTSTRPDTSTICLCKRKKTTSIAAARSKACSSRGLPK